MHDAASSTPPLSVSLSSLRRSLPLPPPRPCLRFYLGRRRPFLTGDEVGRKERRKERTWGMGTSVMDCTETTIRRSMLLTASKFFMVRQNRPNGCRVLKPRSHLHHALCALVLVWTDACDATFDASILRGSGDLVATSNCVISSDQLSNWVTLHKANSEFCSSYYSTF